MLNTHHFLYKETIVVIIVSVHVCYTDECFCDVDTVKNRATFKRPHPSLHARETWSTMNTYSAFKRPESLSSHSQFSLAKRFYSCCKDVISIHAGAMNGLNHFYILKVTTVPTSVWAGGPLELTTITTPQH